MGSIHALIGANIYIALQNVPAQLYTPTKKATGTRGAGGQCLNIRNAIEHEREKFMVMIPLHLLLKDATKEIIEAAKRILPTDLLKVSDIGKTCTVSNLAPPNHPNTCTIAVFNS